MKKPEEIKKGLHNCLSGIDCPDDCPYSSDCIVYDDDYIVEREALAYIQQLESKLNQAVEDIRRLGRIGQNICPVCAHHNHGEGSKEHCITCIINRETDNFEWRGMKE